MWEFPTAVKRVAFGEDDTKIVCITEQRMGHQCAIRVFDINREEPTRRMFTVPFPMTLADDDLGTESKEPLHMFNIIGSKATVCAFTYTPNVILTGHESGKVSLFDVRSGEEIENNERAHSDVVTDLQLCKDQTYFITSSKDKSARVSLLFLPCSLSKRVVLTLSAFSCRAMLTFLSQILDIRNLMPIKTYTTETPLNSAAIAPNRPYVRLGFFCSQASHFCVLFVLLDQSRVGCGLSEKSGWRWLANPSDKNATFLLPSLCSSNILSSRY